MILRPVRTTQPQGAARIDWSNPITRGLAGAVGVNSGTSNPILTGAPEYTATPSGKAYRWIDGADASARVPTATFTGSAYTILTVFTPRALGAGFKKFGGWLTGAGNGGAFFNWDHGNPAYARAVELWAGGVTAVLKYPDPTLGRRTVWAAVVSGTSLLGYADGNLAGSATLTGTPSGWTTLSNGAAGDPTGAVDGMLTLAFNRALSDVEIKSLSDNPWQIFAPDSKSLWVPETVSAGGGATVTTDASADYAIRAAITSDAAASSPVRSATSSDATAAYPLRAATQSDAAAAYAIRSAASADALASYYVLGLVQSDTAGSYAVRAAAQSDALASYAVRSAVQSDALASYEILSAGVVVSDSPASYAIRAAVQADGAAGYPVRSVAQADAACAYAVRAAVWADAGASYAVQGALVAVWADATASYFVDGVVASGVYPSQTTVLAGVQYGPTGVEYTGMLTIGSAGPTAAEIAAAVLASLSPTSIADAVWAKELT